MYMYFEASTIALHVHVYLRYVNDRCRSVVQTYPYGIYEDLVHMYVLYLNQYLHIDRYQYQQHCIITYILYMSCVYTCIYM